MLISSIDLFERDPLLGLITVVTLCASLVIGITVHEFSHAYVATSLGDRTAANLGRLSLNPIRHLDPLGSVLILLAGFGWGKPVPVSPTFLRIGQRIGLAMVSLAGPLSNIIAAAVFGIAVRADVAGLAGPEFTVGRFEGRALIEFALVSLVRWNLVLAVFNLLPIAPLDGFKVALGVLPKDAASAYAKTERYGPGILLILILAGIVFGIPVFSTVIWPVVNLFGDIILGSSLL
ncbi:MAG: site-2 protease family protein [Dehalococcoidia bacterium]|nr:site-2 protease family protein [Dehalococcoidia bacterium]